MNGGPSGFNNASVTKTFVISCLVFTIFFGIKGRSNNFGFSHQDFFQKPRLWKLIVSVFAFSSTPELMFGVYLLYYFRVFERQIGSNKYSVFILFSVIVSLLLELLAVSLLKDPSVNLLTFGPYGLIFASFVPFYFDIPVSTMFRVFGVRFSDKSFIYLAGLQLLFSSWKRSILPGICGILAGSLYRLNVFRIRRIKFPDFVTSFFSRLSWPSTGSPPAPSTRNVVGSVPSYPGHQVENSLWWFQRTYPSLIASAIEPPEDSIAMLVSMGFDRNSARQALVQARNDVNVATNILLEAQSH
ncbi:UBA domain-containing protein/Rhomboid domain-containing protein [Cephalotus follicularis]|uniref:UBA domain-containing protein/Rhomboid domain-containing protein n=1 Tax=Cephalotus follicularis TaxID=3775 RepID=A0A1Q3DCK9_CEPFO|nr:UBA domain-containing protein/Rhomboid domain-containing protein [Cephalotus follicularis]